MIARWLALAGLVATGCFAPNDGGPRDGASGDGARIDAGDASSSDALEIVPDCRDGDLCSEREGFTAGAPVDWIARAAAPFVVDYVSSVLELTLDSTCVVEGQAGVESPSRRVGPARITARLSGLEIPVGGVVLFDVFASDGRYAGLRIDSTRIYGVVFDGSSQADVGGHLFPNDETTLSIRFTSGGEVVFERLDCPDNPETWIEVGRAPAPLSADSFAIIKLGVYCSPGTPSTLYAHWGVVNDQPVSCE